ncbi:peptide synthetase [Caulobacter sp. CCUG 60055]|nr:amino acid synthesis family protein [Caulobacter sp. CCUG 60055]MCI3179585.1 peptide synthetase [Caulobacter sp. CCUG 60055]
MQCKDAAVTERLGAAGAILRIATHFEAASLDARPSLGWAAAVIENPALEAIGHQEAMALGAFLGNELAQRILAGLPDLADQKLAYGKGAIVGAAGRATDAGWILHPRMGGSIRRTIGFGKTILPSTVKVGAPGARLDVPLHGASDEWDFARLDAIEIGLSDAPRPHEIVVALALSTRLNPLITLAEKA